MNNKHIEKLVGIALVLILLAAIGKIFSAILIGFLSFLSALLS